MDITAFKQRMQDLKSYRENNPGKGYWDWKVEAFAEGGDNDPWPNVSVEERQGYYDDINPALGFGVTDFLGAALVRSGLTQRTKAPKEDENRWKAYLGLPYDEQYAPSSKIRFKGDENFPNRQYQGLSKDAKDEIRKNLIPKVQQVSKRLPDNKWIQVTDQSQRDIVRNDVIEYSRQDHIGDLGKFGIRENNDSGIYEVGDKYDFPWYVPIPDRAKGTELMIRDTIWSDKADPSKYIEYKIPREAEGGEIGDPEKERFYQATGRSSSGRPLEKGLSPVVNLRDIVDFTPIGDALSAKDTYDAVKNRDWLGAGLAALTVLPFVPSGLRNVKATARYIPTVNRTEQSLINQALGNISKKRDYLSDIANSRNRVLEDINTIPYRNRAEQADKIFGTNYSETYDLLDDLYQHRYFDLPEVQPKDMVASGRLQAKPFAEERFNKTGVGAEPNEFDLWVNTGMYRDPMQLANHEMNHYTDYIISRNANTTINNNMLKQLENSLKQTDATSYYRKGTEQKAYMNQLRTMLKQNGDVQNLDEPVSSTLLKKYLDKMSDSDPIKKMFKQHKNINAYTKWFNTIPLLGTTALGANAYFNNNKDE